MAYNPPVDEQDPWGDNVLETLDYLKTTAEGAATAATTAALKNNNLSDLASASSARTNLGLGTAAVAASSAFDSAGAATAAQAAAVQRANHTGTQSADTLTDGTTNKAFLATERTKLAGIATAATANSSDATLLARANHTGTQSADTLTDGTTNKAFLATERTKLTGVATGATANSADATLLARANHTGTQAVSTVTGLLTTNTTASSATPAPVGDQLFNRFTVTALAANATFAAPSGTPVDGNSLTIRIKDNGTARTLAWNAIYRAVGVVLPTTTTISKTMYVGAMYNSADSKWDVTAVGQE